MAMAFLAANLAYGLGFSLFHWSDAVQRSSLYQTLNSVHDWMPQAWGWVLTIGALLCIIDARKMKRRRCRRIGTALGMLMWGYASLVYFFTGFYLVFLSVGLLYLTFWMWYYFKFVKKYTGDDWNHLIPTIHH